MNVWRVQKDFTMCAWPNQSANDHERHVYVMSVQQHHSVELLGNHCDPGSYLLSPRLDVLKV